MHSLSKPNVTILKCRISFTNRHIVQTSTPVEEDQPSSRATRFVDDPRRFLVASVEDQTRLGAYRPTKNVQDIIEDGLSIDGKKYAFLGFTDSQLKAGNMMFFREGEGWTVERVLAGCGQLESVYANSGYGKYSARLGLSFSSTAEGLDVPPKLAFLIEDIKAADGSLVTDGIGMIADFFARQLCVHLDIPEDTTVFQIRRGGIKGLLVRYPDDIFRRLCGLRGDLQARIAYRPSMLKYEGGPTLIEVANISSSVSSRTHVNHQFTSLLLTLGIPIKVFESLLECHLERIKCIATDRERAIDFLSHSVAELDSRGAGLAQELLEMLLAGHDMTGPVAACIRTFQDFHYKAISEKLHIDVKEACWLFGVVDEQGILAEDEIYVNLPGGSGVQCRKMVVGRSPAYSPGDIRVLQGIDREELSHLKNCIVFSRNCRRSVPDTMGGGDLDGDKYWVCWDPRLIPDNTEKPEERASPAKTKQNNNMADMKADAASTFATLRGSRILGMMCTSWVKAVEANPTELANDPYARALVPLIETAMDMTKTGTDAGNLRKTFEELQKSRQRPQRQTANLCNPFDVLRNLIPNEPKPVKEWIVDPVLATHESNEPQWKRHYDQGLSVMKEFNAALADGIKKDKDEPRDDKKFSGKKHVDAVKQIFVDRYFKGLPKNQYDEGLRASAWYALGCAEGKDAFAWLGARYLHRIKAEHAHGGLVISVGPRVKVASSKENDPAQASIPLVEGTPVSSRASSFALESDIDVAQRAGPSTSGRTHPEDATATLSSRPATPVAGPSRIAACDVIADSPNRPVATVGIPACIGGEHVWAVSDQISVTTLRHYKCQTCSYVVKEKKRKGGWCSVTIIDGSEPLVHQMEVDPHPSDTNVLPVASGSKPDATGILTATVRIGVFDLTLDRPTHPVATPNIPTCDGPRHIWSVKAGGTWRHYTCQTCLLLVKEKRLAGSWHPQAIIAQHLADRQVQRTHPEEAGPPSSSVQSLPHAAMEKPLRPAATVNIPVCSGADHVWDRRGCIKGGATWRHYTCADCRCTVKEKRKNGIWCSDAVLQR